MDYPEIVIAFVAPVGVNLAITEDAVADRLTRLGYSINRVRVTNDVLPLLDTRAGGAFADVYTRIGTMMDIGTEARKKHGADIISLGIAAEIARRRGKRAAQPRTAYLVHSLKHPEEVHRLRQIYPRGFYLFAVNVPGSIRKKHLVNQRNISPSNAEALMLRDKAETDADGQQVNKTFHLADVFVGWAKDKLRVARSVHRFVDIIFGDPHRTPTFGEYAMFLAFAASLRSADLSRQVGAVIAANGEILSTGANDCPKAGGGLYWPAYNRQTKRFEDIPMGRDYVRGLDSNRAAQKHIIEMVAAACTACKNANFSAKHISALREIMDDSPIGDLTEFGRVVHAEMEAVLSCSRKGVSTRGATIYCTTFPCHNCAKHIIAAGIRRVVFVEPYMKSKATNHHDEVIKIEYPIPADDRTQAEGIVRFEPFFGVGPRRFFDLFSMDIGVGTPLKRKDHETGIALKWDTVDAKPRVRMIPASYLDSEAESAAQFQAVCALTSTSRSRKARSSARRTTS